jgi:hypothetical protein
MKIVPSHRRHQQQKSRPFPVRLQAYCFSIACGP